MKYVIKSKDSVLEEYVILVADHVDFLFDFIEWDLSSTDNQQDATKFKYKGSAYTATGKLNLHEDDWEIVEL